MKKLHLSIYLLFVFTATIVLLNRYTAFHINDYRLHFFFDFFAASSLIIIVGHIFKKLRSNPIHIDYFFNCGYLVFSESLFYVGRRLENTDNIIPKPRR